MSRLEGDALKQQRLGVNFRDIEYPTPQSCNNCLTYKDCTFKGHRGCICDLWEDEEEKIVVSKVKLQTEFNRLMIHPSATSKSLWMNEAQIILLKEILKGDFA